MKNILTLGTLCLMITIMFSSCGTHLSITKRHFNKGYNVEFDRDRKIADTKTADENVSAKREISSDTLTFPARQHIAGVVSVKNTQNVSTAEIPVQTNTVKPVSSHSDLIKPETKTIKNKSTLKEKNSIKRNLNKLHSEEGLSLFWIVILVILILWAVGLLSGGFGLGALINLLLLVVLILLILWLLRVI